MGKRRIAAIIQARMGSTRLPGKTMEEIEGRPLLWHVIQRVKKSRKIDLVVIATTISEEDDVIEEFCVKNNVDFSRGSTDDVLDRYYQAAMKFGANVIVRVTADCPLVDAGVIDELITLFMEGKYDYVSNNKPPSYPHGLDAEVFSIEALERAWKEAKLPSEREHVTPYIWKNPGKFSMGNLEYKEDLSGLRWTLDHPEDLTAIREIYAQLGKKALTHEFDWKEVLKIVKENPEIAKINVGFDRMEGYQKSVEKEKPV